MDWNNVFTEDDYLEVARVMKSPELFMQHGCSLTPHDYQCQYIDFIHMYQHTISIKARQLGVTAATCAYLYWYAINNPHNTIMIMTPRIHMATMGLDLLRHFIETGPRFFRDMVKSINKDSITFNNGAIIISRAAIANNIRGMSLSILYIDEFSSIDIKHQHEIIISAKPSLSVTQGKLILSTTANKQTQIIEDMWTDSTFEKMLLPYTCIDRSTDWVNRQLATMGEERFRYEYECNINNIY